MITEENLDLWVEKKLNVLMTGGHGVGKTAMIKDAFNRRKLNWLYFSASTMDPWVDMIGVPKEAKTAEGVPYLDLVRPKAFQFDEVDAIFFDELNRAPKKVRNAVMELIQFRSINGFKFNNLQMIWGAINPEDEQGTYDVEVLDPAQKDRFEIHVTVPDTANMEYFTKKYGPQYARSAVDWFNDVYRQNKKLVSPRRLDYAVQGYLDGINLRDILPAESQPNRLQQMLSNGVSREKLMALINEGKLDEARKFLAKENVYTEVKTWMLEKPKESAPVFRLLSREKLHALISEHNKDENILAAITSDYYNDADLRDVIRDIQKKNENVDTDYNRRIYNSIPSIETENWGKNPINWNPTLKTNPKFKDMVLDWTQNQLANKQTKDREQIFNGVMNVPEDVDETIARTAVVQLMMCFKNSHISTIKTQQSVIGPLNFMLRKTNMNVATESFLKVHRNKIISAGLEHLVWIPSTK